MSFAWLAAILAAGALAFLVAAPVLGRLSDRIGRRRVLLSAAAGIATGQVVFVATAEAAAANLLPFAIVLAGLAFGRIAYAAAAAGALPVAQAHVADALPSKKRLGALAWLSASTAAGRLLAPPLTALATLVSPFAALHLLSLLAVATMIAVARLRAPQGPAREGGRPPSPAPFGPIAAAMLVMLLVGIVQISLGPWLEARLGLQDLAASRWLGILLGLAAAGALAAQLLLVPRFRGARLTLFTVAAAALAGGALGLELATLRIVSVAGALLFGLGLGIVLPLCAAAVAGSGQPGAALGRLSAAQVLGQAAGAAAGGMSLAAGTSTVVVAPVLVLLALLAFAVHVTK